MLEVTRSGAQPTNSCPTFEVPIVMPVTCVPADMVAVIPEEVPFTSLRVEKALGGLVSMLWASAVNASTYDVYRGELASLWQHRMYSHRSIQCDVSTLDHIDVSPTGDALYYLVSGVSQCGMRGTTGWSRASEFDMHQAPLPTHEERPDGGGCP